MILGVYYSKHRHCLYVNINNNKTNCFYDIKLNHWSSKRIEKDKVLLKKIFDFCGVESLKEFKCIRKNIYSKQYKNQVFIDKFHEIKQHDMDKSTYNYALTFAIELVMKGIIRDDEIKNLEKLRIDYLIDSCNKLFNMINYHNLESYKKLISISISNLEELGFNTNELKKKLKNIIKNCKINYCLNSITKYWTKISNLDFLNPKDIRECDIIIEELSFLGYDTKELERKYERILEHKKNEKYELMKDNVVYLMNINSFVLESKVNTLNEIENFIIDSGIHKHIIKISDSKYDIKVYLKGLDLDNRNYELLETGITKNLIKLDDMPIILDLLNNTTLTLQKNLSKFYIAKCNEYGQIESFLLETTPINDKNYTYDFGKYDFIPGYYIIKYGDKESIYKYDNTEWFKVKYIKTYVLDFNYIP
ncbi:Uncharacterised protein [Clostridioides difficile]|uniref:hypothetical protein n=1 Tax=Clostridioides difficile TaxID=1496 RepID=UPI0010274DF9|nr:hypothetical protein [Clostridioides difficile]VFF93574.1 Uncharacterised protein [Clostridioides difficile]VIG04725.1 Uncharacterised protein [Clostridioides difficile]HBF4772045.1 hypothetical protein [Clostridioides difficile]HBF5037974.1 hypothetical protein [Clostridioides difficile]HBF5410699.1 hypothetical protein [Clostridioides difficile]